jgi:hypothetical protein
MKYYHFFLVLPMCFFSNLQADEGTSNQLRDEEPALREPYPGEEVTNTEGKTVRRWSTRGPVEVSRAPQPFDSPQGFDNQGRFPAGVLLNVDPSEVRQNNQGTYPPVRGDRPNRPKGHPPDGYRPSKR